MCLDVLRALRKHPRVLEALDAEITPALGRDATLDRYVERLRQDLMDAAAAETAARRLVEGIGLAVQAALLVRHAPDEIARAFCASRLGGDWGRSFGTLPPSTAFDAILARAWPM
jgi:putative acyl-CoA dehydrogenase